MEKYTPRISVLIPVYNGINCLSRAIDSVLMQTYTDFEILLIDDGSTDDSASLIKRYVSSYPDKIRYFVKKNEGPGKALEYGVDRCAGEFIAFLDQDDFWYDYKLERQIKEFDMDPELALISSDWCRGERLSDKQESVLQLLMQYPDREPFERLLLENPIRPSSVLVKRSVLLDIGFADIGVSYGPWDRPLWVKIAYKYKIKIMDDILIWAYEHESTLGHRKNYCELQYLYWEYLLTYFSGLSDHYKDIIKRNCADALGATAMYYFSINDFDQFKFNMHKAIKYYLYYIIRNHIFWIYLILMNFPNSFLKRMRKIKKILC